MPRSEKFGNLGPYPEGASFPLLLKWHLENGTRPDGHPNERGPSPWRQANFARVLHGVSAKSTDNPAKNVSNWVGGKNKPERIYADAIKRELFGKNSAYQHWRDDLEDALRVWPRARGEAGRIPPPPPHFLGRDEDVAALLDALLAPTAARAILVRGGPGIGKSSVTRAVGNHPEVVARFGVTRRWFVRLETASTAGAMEDAIARAIDSDPAKGFTATLAALRQRPGLVVLDNLETPWDPPGERPKTEACLAALAAIPNAAVLASFRGGSQPFRAVAWTLVHPVERLHPPFDRQLFQRTAGTTFDGDPHLDEFLKVLEGIPLAIELVALRAHGRSSLGVLWDQWRKLGAEFASDPDYAANPDRLTSLPQSIELSFLSSRMTGTALRLFRVLGQLPAGLIDEDRDALLGEGADGFDAGDALLRIGLAVERGGRLDLLSPIRDYALRRYPPQTPDQAAWPARYLGLTQSLGERIGTPEGGSAMARLLPEFANIEAAFRATLAAGLRGEAMAALKGLGRLTYLGSLPTPEFHKLAEACRQAGDVLGEAKCVKAFGDVALARTDHDGARRAYREALTLHRKAGDALGEANCILRLGDIALRRTEHDDARRAYEEALSLYRQTGDVLGEANCIKGFGDIALARTDHDGARRAYEEALPLHRKAGDVLGEANCVFRLGQIAQAHSDHDSALRAYEEARPLYRQAGAIWGEANCIKGQGNIALARADHDGARRAYGEALPHFRQVSDIVGEASCIFHLGEIALAHSDHDGALRAYEEALPLYHQAGAIVGKANCISRFGDVALARGNHNGAHRAYEEALQLYCQAGDVLGEADCIKGFGDIELAHGNFDRARQAYEKALPLFRRAGDTEAEARCFKALGQLPPT